MRLKTILFILLSGALLGFSTPFSPPKAISKNNTSLKKTNELLTHDVKRFNQELQIIKNEYVQPMSEHQLLQNAMQGMVSGLDPHSSFLDADDMKELETATTGEFSGLGLEVSIEEGLLHVITPIDDGPAQKAGVKAGDWILRINNTPIQGLTLREAVKKMRGKKGSAIQLTLVRKGSHKPFLINIKRELVRVRSVKGQLLDPNLAYIRISSFQENTRKDLNAIISKLQHRKNMPLKGLILDLRNNPGGLLTSASDVANAFLDPNKMSYGHILVYTKGQTAEAHMKIFAKTNNQIYRKPMIVLINQGSASGAEIVAGALQDNKRALILGTKSFGKGSVQTIIPLDANSALKLTTALYYTPAGRSIQAAGISPDILLDELKISTVDEDPTHTICLHEAELKGHLQNENKATSKTPTIKNTFDSPITPSHNELIKNDYQLFTAFNLLKGLVTLEQTTQKAQKY